MIRLPLDPAMRISPAFEQRIVRGGSNANEVLMGNSTQHKFKNSTNGILHYFWVRHLPASPETALNVGLKDASNMAVNPNDLKRQNPTSSRFWPTLPSTSCKVQLADRNRPTVGFECAAEKRNRLSTGDFSIRIFRRIHLCSR